MNGMCRKHGNEPKHRVYTRVRPHGKTITFSCPCEAEAYKANEALFN